jgi:hypothetical protein
MGRTISAPAITASDSAAQRMASLSPAASAATISGDGVSPAASAAASGSPPGNAAATAIADCGRSAGSFSRQRRIARSAAGSRSLTTDEGSSGSSSRWRDSSCNVRPSKARLPVNSS